MNALHQALKAAGCKDPTDPKQVEQFLSQNVGRSFGGMRLITTGPGVYKFIKVGKES